MDAMQEWAPSPAIAVHVGMGASLKIARFDHESRIECRDRDELMMSDLDTGKALGDGSGTGQRRSADADDGKEAAGGTLDGLLHVFAEVTHLGRPSVWANGRSSIGRGVSYTNGRKFGS